MPIICVTTEIYAPIELCFDLARDTDIHRQTASFSYERIVSVTGGNLLALGDEVTFEGVHFGIRQRLTARITEFDRPCRFVDEMVRGAFKSMRHIHEFQRCGDGTVMTDTIEWTSPFGLIGRLADYMIGPHLKSFLNQHNGGLKSMAESGGEDLRSSESALQP